MPLQLVIRNFGEIIGKELERRKYGRRKWGRGRVKISVYKRQLGNVIVVPTVEITPHMGGKSATVKRGRPAPASVDDFFGKLQSELQDLQRKLGPITDIFLPGGGSAAIPKEFEDWCAGNKINIYLIDVEEPGNSINDAIGEMLAREEEAMRQNRNVKKELRKGERKTGIKLDI